MKHFIILGIMFAWIIIKTDRGFDDTATTLIAVAVIYGFVYAYITARGYGQKPKDYDIDFHNDDHDNK